MKVGYSDTPKQYYTFVTLSTVQEVSLSHFMVIYLGINEYLKPWIKAHKHLFVISFISCMSRFYS